MLEPSRIGFTLSPWTPRQPNATKHVKTRAFYKKRRFAAAQGGALNPFGVLRELRAEQCETFLAGRRTILTQNTRLFGLNPKGTALGPDANTRLFGLYPKGTALLPKAQKYHTLAPQAPKARTLAPEVPKSRTLAP